MRLLLVCLSLNALPGSLSFLRSPELFLQLPNPRPAGIHLPPLPRLSEPLLAPPALALELSWLLLARLAARLGRPPAGHCAVEFGGISADVTSLPTRSRSGANREG